MANWFREMLDDIRAHIIHDDRAANLSMPDPTGAWGHGPGEGEMPSSEHLQNLRDLFGMDHRDDQDRENSPEGPAHDAPDHGVDR